VNTALKLKEEIDKIKESIIQREQRRAVQILQSQIFFESERRWSNHTHECLK
jgi:hypothetical protein